MIAVAIFALAMGLCIGSFLNVVAWRLPRKESLSHPPSRCPKCETPIKPYHNVPVLGWLVLRGKCAACGEPISPRYPIVEAITGILYFLVVAICWDDSTKVVLGLMLVTGLVPLTLIDLDLRLLPDKINLPLAVGGLAVAAVLDLGSVPDRLIAATAGFLFFFIAALINPRGMGMGDVKLAFVLGIYLKGALAPALFASFLFGSLFGVGVMLVKGVAAGRKTKVPFGPFMALGALVGLFVGDSIMDSYTSNF